MKKGNWTVGKTRGIRVFWDINGFLKRSRNKGIPFILEWLFSKMKGIFTDSLFIRLVYILRFYGIKW
jgi:hypothetical protein